VREAYAVAAEPSFVAVACLTVDDAGGFSPVGKIRWNGARIFGFWDFVRAPAQAVIDAETDNDLKVHLMLKQPGSSVTLRILEVDPAAGNVILDAEAGVCGAASGSSGLAAFALLLGLSRRRRRR
jgi:uncharacterized protein (TIGR03382 family)